MRNVILVQPKNDLSHSSIISYRARYALGAPCIQQKLIQSHYVVCVCVWHGIDAMQSLIVRVVRQPVSLSALFLLLLVFCFCMCPTANLYENLLERPTYQPLCPAACVKMWSIKSDINTNSKTKQKLWRHSKVYLCAAVRLNSKLSCVFGL